MVKQQRKLLKVTTNFYNMDIENKYRVYKRQVDSLHLLKLFNDFCNQEGIEWSADSGTLLGAIRHNGFIPWDDDIDIIISRKMWIKFQSVISKSKKLVCFPELWFYRVQESGQKSHAIADTPTIDVFIIDNAPNSKLMRKLWANSCIFFQQFMKPKPDGFHPFNFIWLRMYIFHFIGLITTHKWKFKLYQKFSIRWNKKPTKYCTSYGYLFKEVRMEYPANLMEHLHLHQFEDIQIPIVDDYDICLSQMFGDYMTLPKEENRVPRHTNF